jgi:DNA-binding NarL/FixJ family response regulator
MASRRILIVEDEGLMRDLLVKALSGDAGCEVVGATGDGATAVRLARDTQPDAVLMDIELSGDLNGIDAALQIKEQRPATGIVILSAHSDRRFVTSLPLQHPGWAYLLKQSAPDLETVLRAIDASIAGMLMVDPVIVQRLRPKPFSPLGDLRARHVRVLELMAEGYTNAAIATRLFIGEKAVEGYVGEIYQGLQLTEETEINKRVKAVLVYLEESESRVEGSWR